MVGTHAITISPLQPTHETVYLRLAYQALVDLLQTLAEPTVDVLATSLERIVGIVKP